MGMIISWLELNYSRQADPDLTPKLIAWEQTLDTLKVNMLKISLAISSVHHLLNFYFRGINN